MLYRCANTKIKNNDRKKKNVISVVLLPQGQPDTSETDLHRRRRFATRSQHVDQPDHRDLRARVHGTGKLQGRVDHKER